MGQAWSTGRRRPLTTAIARQAGAWQAPSRQTRSGPCMLTQVADASADGRATRLVLHTDAIRACRDEPSAQQVRAVHLPQLQRHRADAGGRSRLSHACVLCGLAREQGNAMLGLQ